MKPTFIIIGIAIVAIVAAVVALSATGPDLDAVTASKDYDAANKITGADLKGATAKQATDIGLLVACSLGGMLEPKTAPGCACSRITRVLVCGPLACPL